MDEIDAALDFKNVSIVGHYIKVCCATLHVLCEIKMLVSSTNTKLLGRDGVWFSLQNNFKKHLGFHKKKTCYCKNVLSFAQIH